MISALFAMLWPPVWGALTAISLHRLGRPDDYALRGGGRNWFTAAAIYVILYGVVIFMWLPLVFAAANALIGAWLWWRKRKNRKRAPKLAGAKSKALLAALVRRAREAAKPRPVLRPQPGGARCA